MYLTIPLVVSALATLASASVPQVPINHPCDEHAYANKAPIRPLACTKLPPTSFQQIYQDSPLTASPQSNTFNVSQSAGGTSNVATLLRFSSIPLGAGGPCSLVMAFSPNYPIKFSGSNTQLNVYKLIDDITRGASYATYFPNGGKKPKDLSIWSTMTVTGNNFTVNSGGCPSQGFQGFLFVMADNTAAGAVTFIDQGSSGVAGFNMTYNC